jgi:hypothetical protein
MLVINDASECKTLISIGFEMRWHRGNGLLRNAIQKNYVNKMAAMLPNIFMSTIDNGSVAQMSMDGPE